MTKVIRRRRRRLLLVLPLVVALFVAWSLVGAAANNGNQSFSAKWADWLRSHHAALVANVMERWYYDMHKPAAGGTIKRLNQIPKTEGHLATGNTGNLLARYHFLPKPANIVPVVTQTVPGEGVWKAVGPTVHGVPGMYEAQFRADTTYTSEITTAVWIDPRAMRLEMVPGAQEPGGHWSHPPYVTQSELPNIAAAFNGGFRFQDAQGGYYVEGKTAVPLRTGAASLVFYKNGSVNVGSWNQEVSMNSSVVGVLQNLVMMVDHNQVSASATYRDTKIWGATLGSTTVVARSGVGVTADGALVYVAGPALTARTLAEALQRAGCIRAMTLDINPEWVTFNFFDHPNPAAPSQLAPQSLYPQMQRPNTRYLPPTREARDFIEVLSPKLQK